MGEERYTYDKDGQLTAVAYPEMGSESFAYDAVGNRTTANGATYTANAMNQYTKIAKDGATATLSYDDDGNLTQMVDADGTTRYFYDTLNRLVAITNTTKGIRWSCVYDVFGNRVSVTDNGVTTERTYLQGALPSVAAEYVNGQLVERHVVVGAVRLVDFDAEGKTNYLHADLIGSTRLVTDANGAIADRRDYKAFGETRIGEDSCSSAGYVGTLGVETDPTGLLFMRNRYYSPTLGRFIQMDPIGLNGEDVNLYRYCGNSPIHSVDVDGFVERQSVPAVAGSILWDKTKESLMNPVLGVLGAGAGTFYYEAMAYDYAAMNCDLPLKVVSRSAAIETVIGKAYVAVTTTKMWWSLGKAAKAGYQKAKTEGWQSGIASAAEVLLSNDSTRSWASIGIWGGELAAKCVITVKKLFKQEKTQAVSLRYYNYGGGPGDEPVVDDGRDAYAVQLWEDGPYWANRNIGATSPEDSGGYFWWGDTSGHKPNDIVFNYTFSWVDIIGLEHLRCPAPRGDELYNGWLAYNGKVLNSKDEYDALNRDILAGVVEAGGELRLAPNHDAATVKWGEDWRMPTWREFYDLCSSSKCKWIWTTKNGINGYEVSGRGEYASASIFLPAAGYGDANWIMPEGGGSFLYNSGVSGNYWTSKFGSWNYTADNLYFSSSERGSVRDCSRCLGLTIRPVRDSPKSKNTKSVNAVKTSVAMTGESENPLSWPTKTIQASTAAATGKPRIYSYERYVVVKGSYYDFVLSADNGATISVAGLPSGLSCSDGVIRGSASATGETTMTITAKNSSGTTIKNVRLIVIDAPRSFEVIKVWSVSFNANGGYASFASLSVRDGQMLESLPSATFDGHEFAGWWTSATGGTQIDATTKVTANVTYYAHWTKIVNPEPEPTPVPEPEPTPEPKPDPEPEPEPESPCYEVVEADDITAAYAAPKAVTLKGAVYDGCDVVGIVELKLGKVNGRKGTSRITASVMGLDGKKKTAKAVTATGIDGMSPVSVSLVVKGWGTMDVTIGGNKFAGEMDAYHVQSADIGGAWAKTDAKVYVEADDLSAFPGDVLEELLPDGAEVLLKNGKWSFAKAASVKYVKLRGWTEKELVIDDTKGKTNLSGMKLTYTPKTGVFKGSFKVYATEGEGMRARLKTYIMKVTGFVINGEGRGAATLKKPAISWTVRVTSDITQVDNDDVDDDEEAGILLRPVVSTDGTVSTADFKAKLTGIAVVSDYMQYYSEDLSKLDYVSPKRHVDVPYGKAAIYRIEYDFPQGYGGYVWVDDVWPNGGGYENGAIFGYNPSSLHYGNGIAYGFMQLQSDGSKTTVKRLALSTDSDPVPDGFPAWGWRMCVVPVDICFWR